MAKFWKYFSYAGESGTASLLPLFFVDKGVSLDVVGFWTGVIAQCLSVLGSSIGGFIFSMWVSCYSSWVPYFLCFQPISVFAVMIEVKIE